MVNLIYVAAIFMGSVTGLVCLSCGAFADSEVKFEVTVPSDALLEVTLFNPDGSAMGNAASMDVMPSFTSAGFNEKDVVVSVGTSNEWGYNLMMNVANTALTSAENNTIANLPEKAGGYTCTPETSTTCDFTVNSWGFKIKNATATQAATNYIPVPTSLNLNQNSGPTNGDPTHISFGSRVNASQAPGAYSTTIVFVATANPDPRPIMQETSEADLASLLPNAGDVITMKDSRDNTGYVVGKLADGNYWMLDNLALDLTNDIILNALDATNTDIDTTNDPGALAALKGTTLGTSSDKYATAKVANWTSSYSYSAPLVNMDSKDLIPQGTDDPLRAEAMAGKWKVGGYYNYCAASAGSYCYGNGTNSDDATSSICPKGWRLPTGSTSGEYEALYTAYSGNYAGFRNAFHVPLSGYYYDGTARRQENMGRFWSSTYNGSSYMYNINVDTSGINPSGYDTRGLGFSVRCVKSDDPLPQMQEVTSSDLTALIPNVGDTATVQDSRDGTKYTIGKLADGKYWMLDNLALDLTDDDILNALSADNTDIDMTNDPGALAALKGTTLGTASDKYATAKVANWTTGNSYSAPLVNMGSKDLVAPTGTSSDPLQAQATAGGWKYGGYYNYCAASAGSYCYGNGTNAGTSSGNATSSICPKGWHMPTSNTGEYGALANAIYGSTGSTSNATAYANFRTALRLPLSGYFNAGSAVDQGDSGAFWSSTRKENSRPYRLLANTGNIYPSGSDYRYRGVSVRCVKSDDPVYMQDVTRAELSNILPNTGDSRTAYDKRDGSEYSIANIDGTYWMTQNLRITGTVTAALSNFTGADFNISAGDLSDGNSYTEVRSHYDGDAKYGAYYNYCAASAGTVCDDATAGNAEVDICPAGWRLPTQAEMQTIADAEGANWNAVAAGTYYAGRLEDLNLSGYWWAGDGHNATNQYYLYYYDDSSYGVDTWYVDYNGGKNFGFTIRCVFGS